MASHAGTVTQPIPTAPAPATTIESVMPPIDPIFLDRFGFGFFVVIFFIGWYLLLRTKVHRGLSVLLIAMGAVGMIVDGRLISGL